MRDESAPEVAELGESAIHVTLSIIRSARELTLRKGMGTLTRVNESQSEVSTISTTMIRGLDTELFPPVISMPPSGLYASGTTAPPVVNRTAFALRFYISASFSMPQLQNLRPGFYLPPSRQAMPCLLRAEEREL